MKWLKRLLLVVVFAAVFVAAVTAAGWWMARATPQWYKVRPSRQELSAAADRADHELERILSWAGNQQALARGHGAADPSDRPPQTLDISFTQDELNGFFQKWDATAGWSDAYGRYLTDPQIVLRDGQLILCATVSDVGAIVSIELAPQLRDGKLWISVERVLAGRLPLPQVFWTRYRQELEGAVARELPRWQRRARIDNNGGANTDAVAAAMGQLLLSSLSDQPAEPVLFLPYTVHHAPVSLPVQVIDLQVTDQLLKLRMQPLTAGQRSRLLKTIQSSRPEALASNHSQGGGEP